MNGHSATGGSTVVDAPRLRRFTRLVFERAGLGGAEAEILADHLVWADLRGIAWLGVRKIPQYLALLRAGHTTTHGRPKLLGERGGFLILDGQDGFGQIVGYHAMRLVIERARSSGVGCAVVRDTTSAGALGYYPSLAVDERMIGLTINNALPLQPAPGGVEKLIGNQAFAIACPAGRHSPLVLDMATSAITLARIHDYAERGEPLPEGVALDSQGEPTIDPAAALAGILLPMAGHRGFGLALMWEVLTGVLAGGTRFLTDVTGPDDLDRPQAVSMFFLAVDPTVSLPYEVFTSRVDDLVDRIHRTKMSAADRRALVAGERSARIAAQRQVEGIPLPAGLLADLRELGTELGVPL
ncbi:MAG TPA: Ldh family oxidoreductase [Streptosporangiaceae bacterium]|nr:Ldh family oxidoreductase [Streptosporangiaceae bacterium]